MKSAFHETQCEIEVGLVRKTPFYTCNIPISPPAILVCYAYAHSKSVTLKGSRSVFEFYSYDCLSDECSTEFHRTKCKCILELGILCRPYLKSGDDTNCNALRTFPLTQKHDFHYSSCCLHTLYSRYIT